MGNENKKWGSHIVKAPRSLDGGDSTHRLSPNDGIRPTLVAFYGSGRGEIIVFVLHDFTIFRKLA